MQHFVETKHFGKIPVQWSPEHVNDEKLMEKALEWTTFKRWYQRLDEAAEKEKPASQFNVEKIELQSIDFFGTSKIGFMKMRVACREKSTGATIPGIVVLRGSSVAILPVLTDKETKKTYVLFVTQPRMPLSTFQCVEIPAGMLDDSGDFKGKAAEEIKEETGLEIHHDELIDLSATIGGDVYLSGGLLDESMRFFAWEKEVDSDIIAKLRGAETGNRHEGEIIVLSVEELEQAKRTCRDSKFWISLSLYENYKKQGQ